MSKSRRRFRVEPLEPRLLLAAVAAPLRVNFQPASAPVPAGYVADVGRAFGARGGGGLSFGWNADNTGQVRARHAAASPDRVHDTLTHLQKPENPNAAWELALPDGTYAVRVVAGDAEHADSVYRTDVEGVRVLDATPTAKRRWAEGAAVVRVTDGRLTVSSAAGARNNKLCSIEVSAADPATAAAAPVTSQTADAAVPAAPALLVARPAAAGDAMRLTWQDRARGETGFRLERAEVGRAWELIATLPANAASYLDRSGLLAGASYRYRIAAFNGAGASAAALGRNQPALPARAALLREYWLNVPGDTVGDLTSAPAFAAAAPSGAGLVANFESATNFADGFGERLRGYVEAPQTGAYRFFVAGDDAADLYLSNDADPANKRLVASIPAGGAVAPRQWSGGPASQQSAPIRLVAGQKYYIELLHKDGAGADHAAVGWQLPDGSLERPIPGWRLSPVRPRVRLYTDESTTIEGAGAAGAVRFAVTRDDDFGRDLVVNYTLDGSASNGTDYSALGGQVTIPKGAASATFSVVPIDDAISEGKETVTAALAPATAYTLGPPSQRTGQATIGDNDNLPPGTAAVVPNNADSFTFYGATRQIISFSDPAVPFTQANRVTNATRPAQVYDIQLQQRNTAALNKNDAMLLTFWARNGNPAKPSASFQVVFEQAGSPYTHSLTYTGTVDANWKRFDVPFSVAEAYAIGGAQLGFQLGFDPQTLDVGGVTLTNFGAAIAVTDLPRTPQTYQGREATAAWRAAAEDRIEQERKAGLGVVVRDAAGNLVDGAAVSVKLLQHDFGFGTAVAGSVLNNTANPDNAKYRQTIKDDFNKVVLENDLKWPGWQSSPNTAINAIDWLNANGITDVRGHNLIWPSWRYIPASPGNTYKGINYRADANKDDSQEEYEAHVAADGLDAAKAWLRQRILDHIAQEAGNASIKGRITDWDVINEPYSEHQIQDILGNLGMVAWFQAAKAADPAAKLFLNDYPSFAGGTHLDSFQQTIQYLLDHGAPLEGIGFQSHFGDGLVGMDQIYATYNRFTTAFHLPMQVTEFDTTVPDLQLQADFLRDFVTLSFSHPDVSSFMIWGFWEGAHWMPSAALWRKDWSIKSNGQAWIDLVKQVWNTQKVGTTPPSGEYRTRGFMGAYEITVTVGGTTKSVFAHLPQAGATVNVTVP